MPTCTPKMSQSILTIKRFEEEQIVRLCFEQNFDRCGISQLENILINLFLKSGRISNRFLFRKI